MKKIVGIMGICLAVAAGVQAAVPDGAAPAIKAAAGAVTADSVAGTLTNTAPQPEVKEETPVQAQNEPAAAETAPAEENAVNKQENTVGKETAPVKNKQNASTADAQADKQTAVQNGKPAQQAQPKPPQVVRRTVKIEPAKENWYLTKPTDFTYYVNKNGAAYSLALPYAFGTDLLAGLPVQGPMIARGADDATAMSFNASVPDGRAAVFKEAISGKQLMPPPSPVTRHLKEKDEEIIEITEFEAPPQYSYCQVDVTPLQLPQQLQNLVLTEAGEFKTFQGLNCRYMQFKCTSGGTPCLLRLTLTEHSGYQFAGFYLFPESKRLTFIPLANYSARSLQCGQNSFMSNFN